MVGLLAQILLKLLNEFFLGAIRRAVLDRMEQ